MTILRGKRRVFLPYFSFEISKYACSVYYELLYNRFLVRKRERQKFLLWD